MDPNPCPRCGKPITVKPRGRPPRWCSDQCRKLASEERRAAERGAVGLQIRERVVTKEVETIVRRPATKVASIDLVLGDSDATAQVLSTLGHRVRSGTIKLYDLNAFWSYLYDLYQHGRKAKGLAPEAASPDAAVAIVLASPRASRAVIEGLTAQTKAEELKSGKHGGTLNAIAQLVAALVETKTMR